MSEQSLISTYGVVYKQTSAEYEVMGDGWAEVHLFKDNTLGSFRIMGWSVKSEDELVNIPVTPGSNYIVRSSDFHKFTDEAGNSFGFGFYETEDALTQANHFCLEVSKAIDSLRIKLDETLPEELKMSPVPRVSITKKSEEALARIKGRISAGRHSSDDEEVSMIVPDMSEVLTKLGPLPIGSAKPAKKSVGGASTKITDPIAVERKTHVEFDVVTKRFIGLPEEWSSEMSNHFGFALSLLHSTTVEGYDSPIPDILLQMAQYMRENEALSQVGIFRIAPDSVENAKVKEMLNKGTFKSTSDVNAVANCLKIFFRELPRPLFPAELFSDIAECDKPSSAATLIKRFHEPNRSVYIWLLDFCVEVASYSSINKMSPQNLAIVIAPNLFSIKDVDPIVGIQISQKLVGFMYQSILWRQSLAP